MKSTSYSGFGVRFLASVLDGVVIWVFSFLIVRILIFSELSWIKHIFLSVLLSFIGSFVYEVFMTWKYNSTLGKMLLNCRVASEEKDGKISFGKSTIRFFSKFLSFILLGIGYLMILWDKEKQGIHDKIAKTHVFNEKDRFVSSRARKSCFVLSILIILVYVAFIGLTFAYAFSSSLESFDKDSNPSLNIRCTNATFYGICTNTYAQTGAFDELSSKEQMSLCTGIFMDSAAYECITRFAIQNNNGSMCQEINSFYYKRLCQKQVNSEIKAKQKRGDSLVRIDKSTEDMAQSYYDSLFKDFDESFISLQKSGLKINTIYYDTDLTIFANIRSAKKLAGDFSSELSNAELELKNISSTIQKLRLLPFEEESISELEELDIITSKYLMAVTLYKRIAANSNDYLELKTYDAEYSQSYDKFISYFDLASTYIDEEKYTSALSELDKSLPYQDKMLNARAAQLENIQFAEDIVSRMYDEESMYTKFVYTKREEVYQLTLSSNTPYSQRFLGSDKYYSEYNEIFVEPVEYDEFLNTWLQDNIYLDLDEVRGILTEADVNYNSLINDFELNWK